MSAIRHFVGLDLGPMHEYTALAVLERPRLFPESPWRDRRPLYALRHLHRFAPGTGYPAVAEAVRKLLRTPPMPGAVLGVDQTGVGKAVRELFYDELHNQVCCLFCPVTVDQTGVGRAVVDLFRSAGIVASLRPFTITFGESGKGSTVAKKNLVGAVQVPLQARRLKIAESLPLAPVLAEELGLFRVKVTVSANETFKAWRERDHDDLVLALALALYIGSFPPVYWAVL